VPSYMILINLELLILISLVAI